MIAHVFPHLRREDTAAPGTRTAELHPYVPADEPAHSPACYCAIEPQPPCSNCVAEGYAQGGAS